MSIRVINPINIGRSGRRDNFRSLSEIRLDVDELEDRVARFRTDVKELERMLAARDTAAVSMRRKTVVGKKRTVKGKPSTKPKAGTSRPKGGSGPPQPSASSADLDEIRANMDLFREAVAIRKHARNAKAELGIRTELRRTRDYKSIDRAIRESEKLLADAEMRAFRAVSKSATRRAPSGMRELMSDMADQLYDELDGMYESSSQSLMVDVDDDADKPNLRFTYYLTFRNMKSDDSGFRYPTAVVVLTHDLAVGGYRVNLLSEYRHPGAFNPGTPVSNADKAAETAMDKMRARGIMQVLTDDDMSPFDPDIKHRKFPGVEHIELDDDARTVSFRMRKGVDPAKSVRPLTAALFAILQTSHPGHLLKHRVSKDSIVFKLDKDAPYLANRNMIDRMARELDMSDEQRDELRDWFVQHMTNDPPDDDKPGSRPRMHDARPSRNTERLDDLEVQELEAKHQDQRDAMRMDHKDELDGLEGPALESVKKHHEDEMRELRSKQRKEMDELRDAQSGERAAVDTISMDGPRHLYEPDRPKAVRQRSVRMALERLGRHFKGDPVPPGDYLYGIAKAIPGTSLQSKIVLLTRPGSVWVEHAILLNDKMDKMLVDHNAYLATEWVPNASGASNRNPENWGEYRAVHISGARYVFKPRTAKTVARFIKDSETHFAVRTVQLQKKRTRPKSKPKPAAEPAPEPKVREKAAAELPKEHEVVLRKRAKGGYDVYVGNRRYHTPLTPGHSEALKGRWVFDDWDWADEGEAKRETLKLVRKSLQLRDDAFMRWWNGEISDTAARAKAGLLPWMIRGREFRVLLLRPGGPDYRGADKGIWTIAKGGIESGETAIDAAVREFREETGVSLPPNRRKQLFEIVGGSTYPNLRVWTVNLNGPAHLHDIRRMTSNTFERGGRRYPEIDKWKWCTAEEADRLMDRRLFGLVQKLQASFDGSRGIRIEAAG